VGKEEEGTVVGAGDGAGESVGPFEGSLDGFDEIVGREDTRALGSILGTEDTEGLEVLGAVVVGYPEGNGEGWSVSVG
jgi:hypothetical protein